MSAQAPARVESSGRGSGTWMVVPALALLVLFFALPYLSILTMSLRDATEVKSAGGEKLDIQIGDDTREVNDARVVDTILTDTNGVILAIDQVLVPDSLDDFADWGD